LAIWCLIANINPFVKADQPVHCLRGDVMGEWTFHVAAQTDTIDLFQTQEVCTHMLPNKV
jgi:hypothetical protein